ncbi:YetF domain-containing protein [Azospirillum sp. SYSU D00513]|uniref:DUF421 domain-containing protein n=1 Tax=Azospirillum sp. SYSU D00513 TaxID=2812561 RepID=UPI001A96D82B|nr:YetF domain-containing protein [Azospirillum sp. SYSU D00513]
MFFNGWAGLGRVLVVGILAYAALVLVLRVSGKRTLTKLNAFDLVVTVALGSTLATVLLSKSVALAEGVLAMTLLVGLQYSITWLSVRSPGFQELIKAHPTMLVYRGSFLPAALKQERVTREEVMAVLRSQGLTGLDKVFALVLETDGSFSVLSGDPEEQPVPTLENVQRAEA